MPDLPDELAALLRERAESAPVPPAASHAVVHAVRRRQYARAGAGVSGTALTLAAVVGLAAAVSPGGTGTITPTSPGPTPTSHPADRELVCGGTSDKSGGTVTHYAWLGVEPDEGSMRTRHPSYDEETATAEPSPSDEPTHEPTEERTAGDEEPTEDKTATAEPSGGPRGALPFEVRIVDDAAPRFHRAAYVLPDDVPCLSVHNSTSTAHRLELRRADTGKSLWDVIEVTPGGAFVWMAEPRLADGSYQLVCTVHPTMRAAVEVGG